MHLKSAGEGDGPTAAFQIRPKFRLFGARLPHTRQRASGGTNSKAEVALQLKIVANLSSERGTFHITKVLFKSCHSSRQFVAVLVVLLESELHLPYRFIGLLLRSL